MLGSLCLLLVIRMSLESGPSLSDRPTDIYHNNSANGETKEEAVDV